MNYSREKEYSPCKDGRKQSEEKVVTASGDITGPVFPTNKKHIIMGLSLTEIQLKRALTWIQNTMLIPAVTSNGQSRFMFDGKQPRRGKKVISKDDMIIMQTLIKNSAEPDRAIDNHRLFANFTPAEYGGLISFNMDIGPIIKAVEAMVQQYINRAWFVAKTTILYSTAGGSEQGWHIDDSRDACTIADEGAIGSVMLALMEGTKLDVMYRQKKINLNIHPGHLIVFHGSLMHRGCAYAKDNVRLHFYMANKAVDTEFTESVLEGLTCKLCAEHNKEYVTAKTKAFTAHLVRTHQTTLGAYKTKYNIN